MDQEFLGKARRAIILIHQDKGFFHDASETPWSVYRLNSVVSRLVGDGFRLTNRCVQAWIDWGNISWVFWFGKRASYDFSLYSVSCLESSLNAGHANCWHKTGGATGMAPLLR